MRQDYQFGEQPFGIFFKPDEQNGIHKQKADETKQKSKPRETETEYCSGNKPGDGEINQYGHHYSAALLDDRDGIGIVKHGKLQIDYEAADRNKSADREHREKEYERFAEPEKDEPHCDGYGEAEGNQQQKIEQNLGAHDLKSGNGKALHLAQTRPLKGDGTVCGRADAETKAGDKHKHLPGFHAGQNLGKLGGKTGVEKQRNARDEKNNGREYRIEYIDRDGKIEGCFFPDKSAERRMRKKRLRRTGSPLLMPFGAGLPAQGNMPDGNTNAAIRANCIKTARSTFGTPPKNSEYRGIESSIVSISAGEETTPVSESWNCMANHISRIKPKMPAIY